MEPAIAGDVAFIRAWKVDEVGNCVFRSGGRFFAFTSPLNMLTW
jgi:3-oxoacid CoA-transferase